MRILQVHNHYRHPGGEDSAVKAEATLLREAGHQVIPYREDNPYGNVEAARDVALSSWNPFSANRIAAFARDEQPDVAHIHNTWYRLTPSVVRALKRMGIPTVMTLHNYRLMCGNALFLRNGKPCELCVGSHPWHGVRHRCYRGSFPSSLAAATAIAVGKKSQVWERDVDLFLALTDFARARFIADGLPADRVWTAPNFVHDPGPRLWPPSESKTIVYAGRTSPEKGVQVLLDAWERADTADLQLEIIGRTHPSLRTARRLPGVEFIGELNHEDVQDKLVRARALVFPSLWYEGLPMVLLEAMAAGLAVAGSNIGSVTETLGHQPHDLLVPPADPDRLAAAIATLRSHTAVDAAGEANRAQWETRYTPKIRLSVLEDAYRVARA